MVEKLEGKLKKILNVVPFVGVFTYVPNPDKHFLKDMCFAFYQICTEYSIIGLMGYLQNNPVN